MEFVGREADLQELWEDLLAVLVEVELLELLGHLAAAVCDLVKDEIRSI